MLDKVIDLKYCPQCKETKLVTEFYNDMRAKGRYRSPCKACTLKSCKQYSTLHHEGKLKSALKYRSLHHRECLKSLHKSMAKLKLEVFSHYSEGKPVCNSCGFDDLRALSIDHINGDGAKHRKSMGLKAGFQTYYWLKRQGYPIGFQVLCMNCQFIKRAENEENSIGRRCN